MTILADVPADWQLARAYALCMREEAGRLDEGCKLIIDRWLYAPNTEADRAFIESVALSISQEGGR
jgi:hypothetical protein